MNTDAPKWSDRWANADELADALDRIRNRHPVLTEAVNALRARGTVLRDVVDLATEVDEHAQLLAVRWGAYDDHAAASDAAQALRDMAADAMEGEWWGDDTIKVEVLTVIPTDD